MFKPVLQTEALPLPQLSSQSFIQESLEDPSANSFLLIDKNPKIQIKPQDLNSQPVPSSDQAEEDLNGPQIDFYETNDHSLNQFRKISSNTSQMQKNKFKKSYLFLKVLAVIASFIFIIAFGVFLENLEQFIGIKTERLKVEVKSVSQNDLIPNKINPNLYSSKMQKIPPKTQIPKEENIQTEKDVKPNAISIKEGKENYKNTEKNNEQIQSDQKENQKPKNNLENQFIFTSNKVEKTQNQKDKKIESKQAKNEGKNQKISEHQLEESLNQPKDFQFNEDLKFRKPKSQKQALEMGLQKKAKQKQVIALQKEGYEQQKPQRKPRKQQKKHNPTRVIPRGITCEDHIAMQLQKYGFLYTFLNDHNQFRHLSNITGLQTQQLTHITRGQFSQAVDLLQLTHHAFENGTILVADTPCETGAAVQKRLKEALDSQYARMNEVYQIDQYHSKQLRFCIVTNSYRNAERGLIYRNIDSILQQNYTNYHVVYTDDASPDQTSTKVLQYLKKRNASEKFKIKLNKQKVGMMENIYNAITKDCNSTQIVIMLDGDDSFIGTNVLSLVNAVYQKQKVAMMWSNFLQILQNMKSLIGFSRDIDENNKKIRTFRHPTNFVSSHLKTFYVDLFKQIKPEDLKHENGSFYGGASDTAMMICMVQMAFPSYRYIPELLYEYRYDTGQVGMGTNRAAQLKAIEKIIKTPPYQSLSDLSFIDRGLENFLEIKK